MAEPPRTPTELAADGTWGLSTDVKIFVGLLLVIAATVLCGKVVVDYVQENRCPAVQSDTAKQDDSGWCIPRRD